jgi:putative aminopeptidase FrvX
MNRTLLAELAEAHAPSGHEGPVREIVARELAAITDRVEHDPLGGIAAIRDGDGGPRLMLAAHMDEIGLIISHVDEEGFLRAQRIGGVDPMNLSGGRVQFADGSIGVIAPEKRPEFRKDPDLSKLYIDVGATSRAEATDRLGQAVGFVRPFTDLGQRVVSKAMDDRIGCVVLVETMRRVGSSPHDLYFVFTVQEEVGLRGAQTGAFGVDPDVGIAVDVTVAADTPEAYKMAMKLGHGPCIKVKDGRMLSHPGLKDLLIETAEAYEIPYQLEVLAWGSTDAAAIQLSRGGVPAGCVSIACRYVHTPSEMVDIDDVENAVKLLQAVLEGPIEL